jgi:tetratricopeptide (TPR) repeat protein
MYAQPPALIAQAVQHFQAGQLPQATALLEKVLSAQPRNFDALHILGVVRAMEGRPGQAVDLFRKALTLNKNHSFLQFNMAKALAEMGRDEEALVHHRWATRLAPDHAEAWLNFGLSLLNLGQHEEAAAAFEKATAINPRYAAAWSNLGLARNRLGTSQQALEALQRALDLQPDLAEAHNNLGTVLDELERGEEALASYDRALQLKPGYAEAWLNKAVKLADLNRGDEALVCFDRAIELSPRPAKAWNYKATCLLSLGRTQEAIAGFRQALSLQPDYPSAEANLGQLLLQAGDFGAGWDMLEQRWRAGDEAPQAISTRRPRWSGAPSDRRVLLWGEQGIGDQILYSSILPDLRGLPGKKLVAVDKRLLALYARSMPEFEFVDLAQVNDDLAFDEHLPLGSLPQLFRRSIESFAAGRHPFLQADPARVQGLRAQIARPGKLVCGVSWSSTRKIIGKHKSINLEQMLLPLASAGLHFVDLQYGDTADEREALKMRHGIEVQKVEEIDNFSDIDGLAALIQACDLVISTSNSTAHLAGALGKETLLLLPSGKRKIWYWTEFDGRNLWYPTVRAYTQTVPGQWEQPVAELRQDLERRHGL